MFLKKIVLIIVCLGLLFVAAPQSFAAGEIEILVDKLVDKGILTETEATIILEETKEDVLKQIEQQKHPTLPKWVQTIKIKQDLRLRYQKEERDSDNKRRDRFRLRYRLNIISNPFDDIEVGVRLATGSEDPRSTNQTFTDNFSTKDINLDLAYLQWKANKNIKMVAGKIKRKPYLWAPTDLLWDGDINPEGASVNIAKDLNKELSGFINLGIWNIDERDQLQGDLANPYMYYTQIGSNWKRGDIDVKVAATVYKFSNVKGNELGDSKVAGDDRGSDTNTEINNLLAFDYDSKAFGGEIGVKNPFGLDTIERFAVFGEYVRNFTISKDNQGWSTGFKFGSKKVKKKGSWQFKYIYAELQRDAWLDIFPDSDRYGGKTDIKSHEVVLGYALRKNLILGVDLYKSQRLDVGKNKEIIGQFDVIVKF